MPVVIAPGHGGSTAWGRSARISLSRGKWSGDMVICVDAEARRTFAGFSTNMSMKEGPMAPERLGSMEAMERRALVASRRRLVPEARRG